MPARRDLSGRTVAGGLLCQEEPVIIIESRDPIHRFPGEERRHNVQRCEGNDALRAVERQTEADPSAAIVARTPKFFMPEHRYERGEETSVVRC
jgi:hypothetical protein